METSHLTKMPRSNSSVQDIIMLIQWSSRIRDNHPFIHFWRDIIHFTSQERLYSNRFLDLSIKLFNFLCSISINKLIFLNNNLSCRISLCIKLKNITMSDSSSQCFNIWIYFTKYLQSRRFQKSFIINSTIEWLIDYKSNILSFWSFNRTNSTIVRWVHISHLKLSCLFLKSSRPKSSNSSLMFNFWKWINLIQKLRKLRCCKEWFNRIINHLKVHQISNLQWIFHIQNWKFSSYTLYKFSHHRLNMRVQNFSHSSHSLIWKMISIIYIISFFMITKIQKILYSLNHIFSIKDICFISLKWLFKIQFCIDLSSSNTSHINSLWKQKLPLNIIQSWLSINKFPWSKLSINKLSSRYRIYSSILLQSNINKVYIFSISLPIKCSSNTLISFQSKYSQKWSNRELSWLIDSRYNISCFFNTHLKPRSIFRNQLKWIPKILLSIKDSIWSNNLRNNHSLNSINNIWSRWSHQR